MNIEGLSTEDSLGVSSESIRVLELNILINGDMCLFLGLGFGNGDMDEWLVLSL